ncbi:MAG: toll/interleukin-1 receptor domain-containing protein [Dehalococcoidia bacterium]|nr:toll/interleukin-1 receptor domain-containing protein [Dehalococcoidia bacterium]
MLKYDGYILESRKKISGKPVYKAVKCQTYEYDWDVFICHASEDKERFVEALASKLRGVQVSVWYDDFSLRLGDQLKDKIDEGLARSRFGIVVLSKYFFVKKWPQDELNVLVQRDSFNRKVILPIWLDVDYNDVFTQSPLLAGHVAARAEEGLDTIVEKILTEIGSG